MKKVRVVQISDLHIGMVMRGERLQRVVDAIKKEAPDILVSTGDLVDDQSDSLLTAYAYFEDIKPRLGKFAVTGNHEFYAGLDRSLDFTRRAGFILLRNEGLTLAGAINIAGVDDIAVMRGASLLAVKDKDVLAMLPHDQFTLFLRHRPSVEPDALGRFDLQLSGHTHKGQVFPFNLVTAIFFPRQSGYYHLSAGSSLQVNRGAGTWGPPIRFLSPPEITVIDLVHKN